MKNFRSGNYKAYAQSSQTEIKRTFNKVLYSSVESYLPSTLPKIDTHQCVPVIGILLILKGHLVNKKYFWPVIGFQFPNFYITVCIHKSATFKK